MLPAPDTPGRYHGGFIHRWNLSPPSIEVAFSPRDKRAEATDHQVLRTLALTGTFRAACPGPIAPARPAVVPLRIARVTFCHQAGVNAPSGVLNSSGISVTQRIAPETAGCYRAAPAGFVQIASFHLARS